MEFAYKKSLGQNFIYDLGFLETMVEKLQIQPKDYLVEVGTGAGTLTKVLAAKAGKVTTFEIDQRLQPILAKNLAGLTNVELILGDALQQKFSGEQFRLVANVPYYITTPLISKFLAEPLCTDLNVLVAREVAERIVAPVGTAAYGALSVACQLLADCDIIKQVPRTLFTPQPKIDSAFVRLQKKAQILPAGFSTFIKAIFGGRRKTILNIAAAVLKLDKKTTEKILTAVAIIPTLRPEQIEPTKFAALYQKAQQFAL